MTDPLTAPALALDESGASDWDACRTRHWYRGNKCYCEPACRVCGHGEHAAIHGPAKDQPPGSKPFGHRYQR